MRIDSRGLLFCNIYAIFVITTLLFASTASADLVNVQYKPAVKTGVATCPVKFPATGTYTKSFRHQLSSDCWSCPKGYSRSLNPNINATDACVKTNSAQYSVAQNHGTRNVSKPPARYNGNIFIDPRNGGEWWECPSIRPRRTLHAVTHKAACATRHIIGESTGTAVFLGKTTRSQPAGTFYDPNGSFYSCPTGYKRTILWPVTGNKACEKPATTSQARAVKRGTRGCPTGSFQNGVYAGCYSCPTDYKRSLEIGADLTKMPKACVKVTTNADFVKFAKAEIDKMRGQIEPLVTIVKVHLAMMPGTLQQLLKAKTDPERIRIGGQIAAPIIQSLKRLNTAQMKEAPSKGVSFSFFPPAIAADEPLPVNLRGNRIESSVKGVPLDQAISVGVVGDASAIIGGNMAIMAAFPTRSEEKPVIYSAYAGTLGLSAGADVSPEIGIWMDPVWGLAGDAFGVTGGVAIYAGFAMTFWWSQEDEPKFLGFTMSPQAGVSAELEFTIGKTQGGGAPTVKPATGTASKGLELPLVNGWKKYSSTAFDAATYYIDETNNITLTGMVEGGRYGDIAQLPSYARPSKRLVFNANNHAKMARVDVLPDGKVKWIAGGKDHGWLSLSDITFNLAPQRALALTNGWSPYHNRTYAAPAYTKSSNIVTLQGLVKKASITQGVIATLPSGYRPSKQLVFTVNNHGKQARVDITPDGRVHWIAGGNDHGWVSLSGINFSIARGQPLSLTNGWGRYPAAQFAIPSYSKNLSGIVTLEGLVKKSSIKQGVITTLPVGFRPDNRLIFTVNNHAKSARVDIHPDGKVYWIAGGNDYGWVSLSGINFKQRK